MVANITFLSFLLFSMCLSIQVVVNTWLNCSFFYINILIMVHRAAVSESSLFQTVVVAVLFKGS